jgi:hypothetical protein
MLVPIHLGLEHPNLVWLVVVAVIAFAAGLGLSLYRSAETGTYHEPASDEEIE